MLADTHFSENIANRHTYSINNLIEDIKIVLYLVFSILKVLIIFRLSPYRNVFQTLKQPNGLKLVSFQYKVAEKYTHNYLTHCIQNIHSCLCVCECYLVFLLHKCSDFYLYIHTYVQKKSVCVCILFAYTQTFLYVISIHVSASVKG